MRLFDGDTRQVDEERVAVELARIGWITPIWISASEATELLGSGNPDQVDVAFVEYYEHRGASRYERLTSELAMSSVTRPWAGLIRQMDTAYRGSDFAIVVPSALVLLEGVLTRGHDGSRGVRDIVQGSIPSPPVGYSLHRVMRVAVNEFVQQLYAPRDFGGEEPSALNRHWILHGRSAADWDRADSLRLLQACYVVTYLAASPA
jgi:hypothetical protein